MSARELSEATGGELSRGMIANIERGAKTDVTIDQMFALSAALGIPPVALALPVDEPRRFVRIIDGGNNRKSVRSERLISEFAGHRAETGPVDVVTPATITALMTIDAVSGYESRRRDAARAQERFDKGDADISYVNETQWALEEHESRMRQLGVDLTVYKIDE
jgi:transcriptional regulator with XRE-family HTH domain